MKSAASDRWPSVGIATPDRNQGTRSPNPVLVVAGASPRGPRRRADEWESRMKLVHGGGRFAVAVAGLVMFAALLTVPPAYAGEVPQLAWLRQFGTPSNDRGFGV